MSIRVIHNYIYSEIVENENDMIGHIAYSLYKSNKIKYIQLYLAEHGGASQQKMI